MPADATSRISLFPNILILVAFLADRWSKQWAALYLAQHGSTNFNRLFSLRETYNQGIAFGMFQGIGRWVGWLTIALLVDLFLYELKLPRSMRLHQAGISLIIGGALGNLVDRIFTGQVLDFIQTPLRSGVFNVADLMIHLGLILAVIGALWLGEPKVTLLSSNHERLETF